MKNILLFLAIAFSSASFAQGNLQFNQVINNVITASFAYEQVVGSVTIPVGKVWKIEAVSFSYYNYASSSQPTQPINPSTSQSVSIGSHCVYGGSTNIAMPLPLWLPAGTYDVTGRQPTNIPYPYAISISAIEFNVVP